MAGAAAETAHLAEEATNLERARLVDEREQYQAARRQDESERWGDDGERTGRRFRRGNATGRQDLYDSDFTDFERMTRERSDD
jgi:hypothetical protein